MRLRSGELPTFLVTVKPTPASSSIAGIACSPNADRPARLTRAALRNCERRFRRRNFTDWIGSSAVIRPKPLSRELLATVATTTVQDRTAILGCHAGAETVTTGTHELAGLISTLHDFRPRRARFLFLVLRDAEKFVWPTGASHVDFRSRGL